MSRTIQPLPLDEAFGREYDIEWLRDMPSSTVVKRYGSGSGPILRVEPHRGDVFIVTVPGEIGTMTLSTLPSPRQFAVFNGRETPVIMDIDHPEKQIEVEGFLGHGLRDVFPVSTAGVIVLTNCCSIVAYGSEGLRWEHNSDLFCCDEPIIDVVGEHILVDGEGHGNVGRKRSVIDARTGIIVAQP